MRERQRVSHEITVRTLKVKARQQLAPSMVRITLSGPELEGFASPGPGDHIKVRFPDTSPGAEEGATSSRDYTPRAYRPAGESGPELDIDFVVHGDEGPATSFAVHSVVGDPLTIAGPRGSQLPPTDVSHVILIADETALPAFSRWLEMVEPGVRITAILDVADEGVESYLSAEQKARASITWLYRSNGLGQLEDAVRALGEIDENSYVWAAGEAKSLVPVRKHLRRERELPKSQVGVDGYWKRGVTNLDHHAPIDPSDPED